MMQTSSEAKNGAKNIISRCLGLSSGHDVLIFADETTLDVSMVLAEAAGMLDVVPIVVLIPKSIQRYIPDKQSLPISVQGIAKDVRVIITCTNADSECMPFREYILETQLSAHTRIGHMPGANLDLLGLANVDFDRLVEDCNRIECMMAQGHELELKSTDSFGRTHLLKADIGGWERLPVASNGVIEDGVWGNVPSGETYIAPLKGTSEGSVVINGSVPGLVVEPRNEIVLYFEQGKLTKISPETSSVARHLNRTQFDTARKNHDPNWTSLAEIGVGVNPAVSRLTGNMLYDEKALGTAHIAVGSNTFMGGGIDSLIHCDMVIKKPTIVIDDLMILDNGALIDSGGIESFKDVSLSHSPLRFAQAVAQSGTQTKVSRDKKLKRKLRPEPGRISLCTIGDDKTSEIAVSLFEQLPPSGQFVDISILARKVQLDDEVTRKVLHIMLKYDIIKLDRG